MPRASSASSTRRAPRATTCRRCRTSSSCTCATLPCLRGGRPAVAVARPARRRDGLDAGRVRRVRLSRRRGNAAAGALVGLCNAFLLADRRASGLRPRRSAVRAGRDGQLLGRHRAPRDRPRPRRQHRGERVGDQPLRADAGGRDRGLRPGLRPARHPAPAARRRGADDARRPRGCLRAELRRAAGGPDLPGRRRGGRADARRRHRDGPLPRCGARRGAGPGRRLRRGRELPRAAGRRQRRGRCSAGGR